MSVTVFGSFLRKVRLDHNERLYDMAKKIGISAAFLSSVEHGRKKIPNDLITKVIDLYNLNSDQTAKLMDAVSSSNKVIDISDFSAEKQEATIMFARKFDELSPEQIVKIKKILDEGDKNID